MTDKFLDLSIEKTNSAYMLFYERVKKGGEKVSGEAGTSAMSQEGGVKHASGGVETGGGKD